MRRVLAVAALLACASSPPRREVPPDALQGVTLGIPPPADLRDTPGIGCGLVSTDLALRAHKLLVNAFADAGAQTTLAQSAPWQLNVSLRQATMGAENAGVRRTDRPIIDTQPDQPTLAEPRASPFNSGNGTAEVVLEASLLRGGEVVWRDNVWGRVKGAPCLEAAQRVRDALAQAVDELRARVIAQLRR